MPLTIDITQFGFYRKGKAEGKAEGRTELVIAMLKSGKLSLENIADISGLSMKEVIALKDQIEK